MLLASPFEQRCINKKCIVGGVWHYYLIIDTVFLLILTFNGLCFVGCLWGSSPALYSFLRLWQWKACCFSTLVFIIRKNESNILATIFFQELVKSDLQLSDAKEEILHMRFNNQVRTKVQISVKFGKKNYKKFVLSSIFQ